MTPTSSSTCSLSPKATYEACRRILERIEHVEEAVTSMAVIQEVVDWLEYNNRRAEVKSFITAVNSYITLREKSNSWTDFIDALDDMEKYGFDYVGALSLQIMRREEIKEIYSNDMDFGRVNEIRIVLE